MTYDDRRQILEQSNSAHSTISDEWAAHGQTVALGSDCRGDEAPRSKATARARPQTNAVETAMPTGGGDSGRGRQALQDLSGQAQGNQEPKWWAL
jgi:hypothetical protein